MPSLKQLVKPIGRNVRDAMLLCGVGPRLDEDDRRVLEGSIFPHFVDDDACPSVLFVGCHWYTWHYNKVFRGKDYWTLEINPARARYGSKQHVVDSVEHVDRHFEPDALDTVFLLGVIGWGLDDVDLADRAVAGVHEVLRPGGAFVIGWDDVPDHRPFALGAMPSLARFEPWTFPPLGTHEHRCDGDLRHTFNFYRKPE